jgi:hypothetical protein
MICTRSYQFGVMIIAILTAVGCQLGKGRIHEADTLTQPYTLGANAIGVSPPAVASTSAKPTNDQAALRATSTKIESTLDTAIAERSAGSEDSAGILQASEDSARQEVNASCTRGCSGGCSR